METQFTPIAMRCTKEQFKAIEPKLKCKIKISEDPFIWFRENKNYLTNDFNGRKEVKFTTSRLEQRTVYKTWDEATFLKACGIEVDTYTVSKDFILEAHKDASPQRKLEIENEFKELFPKVELELNKWYWVESNSWKTKALICFDNDNFEDNYGFCFNGNFDNEFNNLKNLIKSPYEKIYPATKEEVETALIAEAKKRGFKDGVNIIDLYNGKEKNDCVLISSDEFDYEKVPCGKLQGKIALRDSDGSILFVDGKWAEIISEPIELTLEQRLERIEKHLNIN